MAWFSKCGVLLFLCPVTSPKVKDITRTRSSFIFCCMREALWELQTQIILSQQLRYLSNQKGTELLAAAESVSRALNGLITSVSATV
jgi:hypothetical protein